MEYCYVLIQVEDMEMLNGSKTSVIALRICGRHSTRYGEPIGLT